jgi:hypothetical protein
MWRFRTVRSSPVQGRCFRSAEIRMNALESAASMAATSRLVIATALRYRGKM